MPKEAEGVGSRIQLKHVRDHGVDHKNAFQEVLAKKQQQEVSVFCFVLF
jgi:demethoxyubiquinone hydroxylase (CLK1/Coq7/Cat5 family)